jgi:7-carboxy-7-deazaguanine synthase
MAKLHYTELFYSAQGEGRFVGVPSVFLRTFGCNFRCKNFGLDRNIHFSGPNPEVEKIIKIVKESPDYYKTFDDLPLVSTGCDSYSSIYSEFKKYVIKEELDDTVEKMLNLVPGGQWQLPNGNNVHLVITGGEPLLGWQRTYPDLLSHGSMYDLTNLTFETNGTQPLHEDFVRYMKFWGSHGSREITFSVSAKLSASGERWKDAIKPEIVASYQELGHTYLKFVVESPADFDEVDRAVKEYRAGGFKGMVYIMPVGGVIEMYHANMTSVADECMKRGYYFSPRLHTSLWGNAWGK